MAKEKFARSGEYAILQTEEGSIITAKIYDNVKGALREVSEKIGFTFDPAWTTRQFGSKLLDFRRANEPFGYYIKRNIGVCIKPVYRNCTFCITRSIFHQSDSNKNT